MPRSVVALDRINLDHLKRLTDDTGIIQHGTGAIPNRKTGYTTDDNARALLVAVQAARMGDASGERLAETYLAFLVYAQGPDGWFHNFFSYDRRPLPEIPSDDCQGRVWWALAEAARYWGGHRHSVVASRLLGEGLTAASRLDSPRGWAGAVLACAAWLDGPGAHREAAAPLGVDEKAEKALNEAAEKLAAHFQQESTRDWYWCEEVMTYDNAMLPFALLRAARHTGCPRLRETGTKALGFLNGVTFRHGYFTPIGNRGWYPRGGTPALYDQQALEATATVYACLEAYKLTGETEWKRQADLALLWFLGENSLGIPLYDPSTGGCFDGLGPDGVNTNQGAESTLAWLMAVQALPSRSIAA